MEAHEELRATLKYMGWTRKRLHEETGVSLSGIDRWLSGRRQIPVWLPRFLELTEDSRMFRRLAGEKLREGAE